MKPQDRLENAYAGPARDKAQRKLESHARAWRHDPQMEALLVMKRDSPDRYDQQPANLKASLGYYLTEKEAAEAIGIDTGGAA